MLRFDRTFRLASVIMKSKVEVYLVEGGFCMPFTVILKVYRGLIPARPLARLSCAWTELFEYREHYTDWRSWVSEEEHASYEAYDGTVISTGNTMITE